MEMTANFWSPSAGGGGDWRSSALARAPQVVTFVLALALAAQLAFIVVGMTSRSRQTAPPSAAAGAPVPQLDIGGLVNAHLFGNAVVQSATAMPPMRRRRACRWCWPASWRRTIPSKAWPSLERAPRPRRWSLVGQQVPGGALLHSVYSDRAIIDRSGVLESVLLPRRTAGTGGHAAAAPAAGRGRRQRRRARAHAQAGERRSRASSARSCGRSRCSPAARCAASASIRAPIARPSRAWDCAPGDLVTAINGTPLDDKDRAQEIFGTLNSSTDARVTITRNGRQQELVLNIAQIAAEAEQLGSGGDGMIPMDQAPPEPRRPGTNEKNRI